MYKRQQIASIDCSKDSFELLSNTAMPRIKSQLIALRNCSAHVVYSTRHPTRYKKAFLWPKTLDLWSLGTQNEILSFSVTGQSQFVDLTLYFDAETDDDFSFKDLRIKRVITHFNDLYVGDLAFLAMVIGMNNSAGAHCIHCKKKAMEFNCDHIHPQDIRTKESLTESLNEYNRQRHRSAVRNWNGVNQLGLLDIDPQRIIVPLLHCPMGLVDKVLESFKAWVIAEVELLPAESNEIREAYANAKAVHVEAKRIEGLAAQGGNTAEAIVLFNEAKAARSNAQKEEKKAKDNFEEMATRHRARLFSLSQIFDNIFRENGIKKEHYHGGKYNGVNCIRIMDKSDRLFDQFKAAIKVKKIQTVSDEDIEAKCNQFTRMFGLMDATWSNVRGIDAGLLPTNEQVGLLRKAISEGKALWLQMNITTRQPKWHLTFDGHLLHQVITYGGLADKSDDTIEFQHQMLMKLRDRYRSITSFQRREGCIRRELRRRKSPEIQSHIDAWQASVKEKGYGTGKRQEEALERQAGEREAKRAKREAVLEG